MGDGVRSEGGGLCLGIPRPSCMQTGSGQRSHSYKRKSFFHVLSNVSQMAASLLSVEEIQLFHSPLVFLKYVISGATAFGANPNCIPTRQAHAIAFTAPRNRRSTHQQTRSTAKRLHLYLCMFYTSELYSPTH